MGEMELVELGEASASLPEASSRLEPDEDGQAPSFLIMKVASLGALGGFLFGCARQVPLLLLYARHAVVYTPDLPDSVHSVLTYLTTYTKSAPPRRYDLALIGGALLLLKDELHLSGAMTALLCNQFGLTEAPCTDTLGGCRVGAGGHRGLRKAWGRAGDVSRWCDDVMLWVSGPTSFGLRRSRFAASPGWMPATVLRGVSCSRR